MKAEKVIELLRRFAIEPRGNIAVTFAFSLVPLVGLAGGVVDVARWHDVGNVLQNATDAAALSAAAYREKSEAERIDFAESLTRQNWAAAQPRYGEINAISVVFDADAVTVTATVALSNLFLPVLGLDHAAITRASVAGPAGSPKLCVVALGQTNMNGKGAIEVNSNATVNLPNCTMHSNSSRSDALYSDSNASVTANHLCAVGEAADYGSPGFSPEPETGCEPAADPFAGIPVPTWSACDHTDKVEYDLGSEGTADIYPGVYCGSELLVKGSSSTNAVATFHSGEYIIKGGVLKIDSDVKVIDDGGDGVLFYLTDGAVLNINGNVVVDLSAPKTGPRAGILFFENPSTTSHNVHQFNSNAVSTLDGAIYLPMGHLQMDSNGKLESASLRTRVVAYSLNINSNFQLNLTADFDGASGDSGSYVRLMQ